jgi:cell division protein FtsL
MSTATATARRAPRRAPVSHKRRPRLRLVQRTRAVTAERMTEIIAISILVVSLFVIVIGHAMLAQGQLRLGHLNDQLTKEQAVHTATVLQVAALETPARISSEAGSLNLVQPSQILQLPSVSLNQPLPTLKISAAKPAPAAPATTPTTTPSTPTPTTTPAGH